MGLTPVPVSGRGTLRRQIAAGAGWSLAARVAVSVLGLSASAILARLLPVENMGAYLLASSLVVSAAVVAGAGVNQLCIRYVAEHLARAERALARHTLRTLLRLGLAVAAVVAVVFAVAADALMPSLFGGVDVRLFGVLLGGWVFLLAGQALVSDCFRGFADLRAASLYGGPFTSAMIVVGLLAVLATGSTITLAGALLLVVAAAAVNVGSAGLSLRRRVRRLPEPPATKVDRLGVRKVLEVSLPLLLSTSLLLVLAGADLWTLGVFWPAEDVASYGVAARTATLVGMPLLVVYGVLPPFVSGLYSTGDHVRLQRLLQAAATAAAVPAGLLTVTFVTGGGPLLALVYGEHYRSGAWELAVLSAGQLASVVAGACGLVLTMTGHQGALLKITAATVLATVALLVLTVPVWGPPAAAIVAATGLAVQNVGMAAAARRFTGLSTVASPAATVRLLREVLS